MQNYSPQAQEGVLAYQGVVVVVVSKVMRESQTLHHRHGVWGPLHQRHEASGLIPKAARQLHQSFASQHPEEPHELQLAPLQQQSLEADQLVALDPTVALDCEQR